MARVSFDDFCKVQNLEFDILKLKQDLDKILKKKNLTPQELRILVQYLSIKFQMT